MGYDVTYHPIFEAEINKWYFDVLLDNGKADALAEKYNVDGFYIDKYKDTIKTGLGVDKKEIFDKTHGFYMAAVQ
jgi:hypothetical protein